MNRPIKNINDIMCMDLDGPISQDLYKQMTQILLQSYKHVRDEKDGMNFKMQAIEKRIAQSETSKQQNNNKCKQKLLKIEQVLNKRLSLKELVTGRYDMKKFEKYLNTDDL